MKKILHLTPLYFNDRSCLGGGERYPLNLARGVVEASAGPCGVEAVPSDTPPRRQVTQSGVPLRLLPAVNQANPLRVLSWELPAAIAGADLVHIHQAAMRASEVALLIARQQRKP